MSEQAKSLMQNGYVVDCLFHDMIEDPPLHCTADRTLVDMVLEGGVTTVSTTIKADTYGTLGFMDLCRELYQYYLFEETLSNKAKLIYTYQDIVDAKKAGKLGIIMSTQGADVIENDIRLISMAYKLGLRIVQITYNQNGHIGSGVFEPTDLGLTRFGQQAIYEMNRVGMLIDLSHVGYKTTMDAMAVSKKPVVFSHSSVKALCKNRRNLADDQIKACAQTGGVICLCPHSVFCTDENSIPDVDVFINHMKYVADLVGVEYIGIGTDRFVQPTLLHLMSRTEFSRTLPGFFGPYGVENKQVTGFNHFNDWENLADNMLRRGFSESDVGKVLGNNLMRVFKDLWM